MTDPRGLLDAYAAEETNSLNPVDRDSMAPKAFDALRAVLGQHKPIPGIAGAFCLTCWDPGKETMVPMPYPCPTVQAITSALS